MILLKSPTYIPEPRGWSSDPQTWQRVPLKAHTPLNGVSVSAGGLFDAALKENIDYLLRSFTVDHMLYPFRTRAGQLDAPMKDGQIKFWDTRLEGSNAGRFLMGAGNALRWGEHVELSRRMDDLVAGIAACQTPEGYIHAFPAETMIQGDPGTVWGEAQRSNYARAWLTCGLLDAVVAGNTQALPLVRAGHDWFNHCPDLADLPKVMLWAQGHIASTRMYFSELGKAEDLQVAERYYVVDKWMEQLARHDLRAIWLDGLGAPHCYEITVFEAYLDHYLATGDVRYLNAVEGAWEMMHQHWLHTGGSVALCEAMDYPPGSRFIRSEKHTGEFCGSVFWAKLNQRFHWLHPQDERYVSEIEKTIYNVGLANQVAGKGIRYHTHLEGFKDKPTQINTCCEGQGNRFLSSLPEFIYSLSEDGIYINLFEPSRIETRIGGSPLHLAQETGFPFNPQVKIILHEAPERLKLYIRVPSWASGPMRVKVNGEETASGAAGSNIKLERRWSGGDRVEFDLPAGLQITRYRGADNFNWQVRAALTYGPLLLAVVGAPGEKYPISLRQSPERIEQWLRPVRGEKLRWEVAGHPEYLVMPYWQVSGEQHFSCFPVWMGSE